MMLSAGGFRCGVAGFQFHFLDFLHVVNRQLRDSEQAGHIDNQREFAVPHNGRAIVAMQLFDMRAQRFDDDLLRVAHFVHNQPEPQFSGRQHHDMHVVGRCFGARHIQNRIQAEQRQQFPAQPVHFGAIHDFDVLGFVFSLQHQQFFQIDLRNGEAMRAGFYDQDGNNGKGNRDADFHARPFIALGMNVNNPADFIEIFLHDIHADAAPGDAGHGFCGGESRTENQVNQIPFAHFFRLLRRDELLADRFGFHLINIDARAIITDFDHHLAAFVIRLDHNRRGRWLSEFLTFHWFFDAMIQGIAD